jgi:hypothetical protein
MATFTIINEGIINKAILVLISSTSSSCQSIFNFEITGSIGDSMTITYTDDTGGSNFKPVIGSAGISSPATFTSNGTDYLTVYVNNTSIVETTQLTFTVVNNTTLENDSQFVTRDSTGITC